MTKSTEHKEAKRQQTKIPTNNEVVAEGSHGIDHMTVLDNEMSDDTNAEGAETIAARNANDLSFWGGSWTWTKSKNSYGDKPEDSWFINPTPQLIGEVLHEAPLVHSSCEVALLGDHAEQLNRERGRHTDFLRECEDNELVSESLDLLKAYQNRYFESVQQYIGRRASYESLSDNDNASDEDIEAAEMRKLEAASSCRGWVARLIALIEAYHEVVTDERAYNLSYDFGVDPSDSRYGLYRYTVTQALNNIGRRLTRSIKTGKMDAEKYRIPKPWTDEAQRQTKRSASDMVNDFT